MMACCCEIHGQNDTKTNGLLLRLSHQAPFYPDIDLLWGLVLIQPLEVYNGFSRFPDLAGTPTFTFLVTSDFSNVPHCATLVLS